MGISSLSRGHKDIIEFFNGEFDYIHNKCKKYKSTLGWSKEEVIEKTLLS